MRNRTTEMVVTTLATLAVGATFQTSAFADLRTRLVNVDSNEMAANALSDPDTGHPVVSRTGRFVAFTSFADNLSPKDSDGTTDVFLRDKKRGITLLVSQSSAGVGGDAQSFHPSISANGRWVAFWSLATNLVPGDTNGKADVFLRDMRRGRTHLISVSSNEDQGNEGSVLPSVSDNGRFIAFESEASSLINRPLDGNEHVFVRDRKKGLTYLISQTSDEVAADGDSSRPDISPTGRFVAFVSWAAILAGHDDEVASDIFVRDRKLGTTSYISQSSSGVGGNGDSENPSISANGRLVAFQSFSNNLVEGDVNGEMDIFIRNIRRGRTSLISLNSSEVPGNDVSFDPSLSASGRFVAFNSTSSNLSNFDSDLDYDIFVRDRRRGRTQYMSQSTAGEPSDGVSFAPGISANGRWVAFISDANNLNATDNDGFFNVFLRGRIRYGG